MGLPFFIMLCQWSLFNESLGHSDQVIHRFFTCIQPEIDESHPEMDELYPELNGFPHNALNFTRRL